MKKQIMKKEDLKDGFYYAEIVKVETIGNADIKGKLMPVCMVTYRLHQTYVELTQRYIMLLNFNNKLRCVFESAFGRLPADAKLRDLLGANIIINVSTNISNKTGKIFKNVHSTFHLDNEGVLIIENEPEEMTIDFASADFRALPSGAAHV